MSPDAVLDKITGLYEFLPKAIIVVYIIFRHLSFVCNRFNRGLMLELNSKP
jgi:hypothetical protein